MNTLIHFDVFVNEIAANNSRNYKLEVLKKYKSDEEIKIVLKFLFDPYMVTGLSDKKLNKIVHPISIHHKSLLANLEYLEYHNTGTDYDIAVIQNFRNSLDENLKDLFGKIVTKNLQLGIDVLSINKAMGDFIPTFSVQLANKYFDKPEVVNGHSFTLTTKIDGGRIIAIKENDTCEFYTRAGQRYEGLVDLEQEMLNKLPNGIALDGEITLLNPGSMTSKEQYKATMKITRKDGEKHGVKMKVFDILPASEFRTGKCSMVYEDRRNALEMLFSLSEFKFFELLPVLYSGTDTNQIVPILNEQVANGEEGIMINLNDACYEYKRCNGLLKCKLMKDLDLTIIDFEEGTNKNAGTLGAIVVDYKGNRVKVGSGFSDIDRNEIWNHKEDYLGMTATVQYFEETHNADGGISLRFPIYLGVRTDK